MFLDELTPIVQTLVRQPIAFLGGFASGVLRLDLSEDPVKSWLEKQPGGAASADTPPTSPNGPQSISID
ncbi:MAG: hypothetical protein AAFZ80_06405 [Cyanobacteria bacterium P01_A01_bin.105]